MLSSIHLPRSVRCETARFSTTARKHFIKLIYDNLSLAKAGKPLYQAGKPRCSVAFCFDTADDVFFLLPTEQNFHTSLIVVMP